MRLTGRPDAARPFLAFPFTLAFTLPMVRMPLSNFIRFFLFLGMSFSKLLIMCAVVNLTLIDLPGLTKVAVGKWHLLWSLGLFL